MSNCSINNKSVNKFMLGYIAPDSEQFRFDFRKWKVNPVYEGAVDVYQDKIIIKRIYPQKYIIISQETDTSATHIQEMINGSTLVVAGVKNLVDTGIITNYVHATNYGPNHTGRGIHINPANTRNYNPYSFDWPWELGGYQSNRVYGCAYDGEYTTSMNQFAANGYPSFQVGIYILTGATLPEDQDYFDISENPVTVSLKQNFEISLERAEIWDMYDDNNNLIYHKDKTVNNCWKEYGYLQKPKEQDIYVWNPDKNEYELYTEPTNVTTNSKTIKVPLPVDLNAQQLLIFDGFKPYNTEIWNDIQEYLNTHHYKNTALNIFRNTNIPDKITVYFDDTHESSFSDMFMYSSVKEVELVFNNSYIKGHNLFRRTSNLTKITVNSHVSENDIAGIFEQCPISEIPANIFHDWANRYPGYDYGWNNIAYAFNWTRLTEIPQIGDDRYAPQNTIVSYSSGQQAFQGLATMTKISPVIDMCYAVPELCAKMFCESSLTDVRIKNLNHGDWKFTGTSENEQGYMPNLDAESVKYLFDNLTDLNLCDDTYVLNNVDKGYIPRVSSAKLYCPAEWSDKVTADMITAAKAKNWTIYIGGTEK